MKKRIIFMGTPVFAANVLKKIIKKYPGQVVGVVTQPDKPFGRKKLIQPTPVKQVAMDEGIIILQPEKVRIDHKEILELKPDIILTAAYGQIIPQELIDFPEFGCVNFHGSILPKYRGGAPIQRAIMNGEKETGITLMYMNAKMDEGNIIKHNNFKIENNDTTETVFLKMENACYDLIDNEIDNIFDNKNASTIQNHNLASYAPNIRSEDCEIKISEMTSQKIHNIVRALFPRPGAFIIHEKKKFKILKTILTDEKSSPSLVHFDQKNKLITITGIDGIILIVEVIQAENKTKQQAKDYLNGMRNA
jgi:methionyl-tRNA formyltransferase